jgi:hypothetical protein
LHLLPAQHGDALRFERHRSSQDAGRNADVVESRSSLIHLSLQPALSHRRCPFRNGHSHSSINVFIGTTAERKNVLAMNGKRSLSPITCDNFGAWRQQAKGEQDKLKPGCNITTANDLVSIASLKRLMQSFSLLSNKSALVGTSRSLCLQERSRRRRGPLL